jgi:DNA replication and repair protein RecF
MVLAQRSKSYLEDLLEYRRILRQRNRILFDARSGRGLEPELIDPWTDNLVRTGSRIMARRSEFVREFLKVLVPVHHSLAGSDDDIEVVYHGTPAVSAGTDVPTIAADFHSALESFGSEEMRRGVTMAGPQRDDLVMSLNGMSVQDHASQGQHKTILLSMKIAERDYLSSALEESPVLLLDDLFGELDAERSERIVRLVSGLGQSVITTTSDKTLGPAGILLENARRFLVRSGTCEALV